MGAENVSGPSKKRSISLFISVQKSLKTIVIESAPNGQMEMLGPRYVRNQEEQYHYPSQKRILHNRLLFGSTCKSWIAQIETMESWTKGKKKDITLFINHNVFGKYYIRQHALHGRLATPQNV